MKALGIVEVKSMIGAIQAADTMLKSADVDLVDINLVGSGIVAAIVKGDVAAVNAAVENGEESASKIAEIISTNVIARPHDEVSKIL
ncbi:Microcompartment protein, bacteria [Romboutsia lituseburensis]|uniref:BMC domain-containing protein n=1 Tax=Romboutsia lituseburensis DSM 797 TaxID=1121325 RepID=A0A1G9M5L5_9FIRM|nr:BMC domain-containing protein [Romboutsia lituseburensis]CEH34607.1 Microcompartment protein, bacteria [Romboutsia lituseburensis]SDL69506.1 BMC domain-containing protein [Romboutsia lituseburensis DSM 797]